MQVSHFLRKTSEWLSQLVHRLDESLDTLDEEGLEVTTEQYDTRALNRVGRGQCCARQGLGRMVVQPVRNPSNLMSVTPKLS